MFALSVLGAVFWVLLLVSLVIFTVRTAAEIRSKDEE